MALGSRSYRLLVASERRAGSAEHAEMKGVPSHGMRAECAAGKPVTSEFELLSVPCSIKVTLGARCCTGAAEHDCQLYLGES